MRQGGGGRGGGGTIAERLAYIERRLDALDDGLQMVHPDYADPIVRRVSEMETLCREHVNRVGRVMTNQRQAVEATVSKAAAKSDEACARLAKAADRHQQQGAELRSELGNLKDAIDAQSQQVEADLQKMEKLASQALEHLERQELLNAQTEEQLQRLSALDMMYQTVHASVQDLQMKSMNFKHEQEKVIASSRVSRAESLPVVVKRAQRVASSRSPSAEAASRLFRGRGPPPRERVLSQEEQNAQATLREGVLRELGSSST